MTVSWNRQFHNVALAFEPRIIRVKNDDDLWKRLKKHGRKHSRQIAANARSCYEKKYGKELDITERSLACEIYGHYAVMKAAVFMDSHHIMPSFAKWLIRHIDVIDCGERKTDSNRFFWDIFSVFF